MKITDEMMKKLCKLSALEIDDSRQELIKKDLSNMIEYIDIIKAEEIDEKIDLENNEMENVLRKDEESITPADESLKLIGGAPQKEDTYVVVPKTT